MNFIKNKIKKSQEDGSLMDNLTDDEIEELFDILKEVDDLIEQAEQRKNKKQDNERAYERAMGIIR